MAVGPTAAAGQFVFVAGAFGLLAWSFLHNDFSLLYVASNSNSKLPEIYRFAAVWGGHEGSLLLWVLVLSAWTIAVTALNGALPREVAARITGVMGAISVGFLAFILFTSNPFLRLSPVPFDGNDLNPLLQDPAMAVHPPMLYMGYVGFSVAFAFAVAALLAGRLDQEWARWARPWTTAAWVFLTVGIALGSWWAYYELGWGGWWFWDPVENASFMPWLVGTALMHSLAVTEKRGIFKGSTLLLAIAAFSLEPRRHFPRSFGGACFGAFICRRSGPRTVHPDLSCHRHWHSPWALRVARTVPGPGRWASSRFPGRVFFWSITSCCA